LVSILFKSSEYNISTKLNWCAENNYVAHKLDDAVSPFIQKLKLIFLQGSFIN